MGLRKIIGQRANVRDIPYQASACSMLRVETADGEAAPITFVVEPVRSITDVLSPASESEAQAILEYGVDQGTTHKVTLDCARGLVLTVTAVHLKVDVRNIGGGQAENSPTRRWKASASIHATARVTPATVHERIGALVREEYSPQMFVPGFAFAWSLPRTPQGPMLVSFAGGAGQELAVYKIERDTTPQHRVPAGADRVRVRALDDGLVRGRLQFELAL